MSVCGYDWGSVHSISDTSLASIPEGAAVTAPPCP